ncbi:hypothetical protein D9M70_519110 [compost metagenome]
MVSEIISGLIGGILGVVSTLAAQKMQQCYDTKKLRGAETRKAELLAYEKVRSIVSDDALRALETLEAYSGYPASLWDTLRKFEYDFDDHLATFHSAGLEKKFQVMRKSVMGFMEQSSKYCTQEAGRYTTVPRIHNPRDKQRFRDEAVPVDEAARTAHKAALDFLKTAKIELRV